MHAKAAGALVDLLTLERLQGMTEPGARGGQRDHVPGLLLEPIAVRPQALRRSLHTSVRPARQA